VSNETPRRWRVVDWGIEVVHAADYDALQAELAEFLAENERLTRALALADRALEQAIADRVRETTT
jgi:hypothetical protein